MAIIWRIYVGVAYECFVEMFLHFSCVHVMFIAVVALIKILASNAFGRLSNPFLVGFSSMNFSVFLEMNETCSTPIFARKAEFCSIFQDLHQNAL